ncbi:hypothetical protein WOLCODRAFT_167026 [Wolfiporia cocos MD-104 SS10]|uniref:FAD-binding domain-containing protein n=1 Tax=Wolfiporia cocos (strain MD-104) TaxID=742152 RepID=A0A2H3J3R5_WOLCO|nr:hypothetical protein WOLCODRAFT_167026 [Wolfiporia cocos MD-104 SS10]
MLRATEDDDTYFIFIGGRVDHAKIAQDRDELIRVLREGTGRSDIELGKVRWLSEYKPHIRMAEKFGQERVFVVGDAAHIHSPFGGQGLNSSVQDSINLGWKLSLVEKGVALPSLLSTYTEERLPVIAEVLKTSNRLFDEAVSSKSDGSTSEKAWHRGGPLNQLGVNYRWSSITIDDRFPREERPLDPYGIDRAPGPLRAGERAPDAPGLVKVSADPLPSKNTGQVGMNFSLFDIFRPSYHTVLIFDDNIERLEGTLRILRSYPSALIRSVIVLPHGPSVALPTERGDLTVIDGDGHAYQGYAVDAGTFTTVIVRPDGAVGGVITQPEGMKRYFTGIFSAITA